eukprot:TRINITY_DN237_c0_g1_i1.p2 TRINITY_DN237_c0_g1~~TRINITY_DN237_c0_g1_i1.p2  ORF type:complete len:490 (+),score=125.13 TRINITY_DN237_c0_g1_i1:78-1472(+)
MLVGPPAMLLGRPAKLVGLVSQWLLAEAAQCKRDFAAMSRRKLALYALAGAVYIAAVPKVADCLGQRMAQYLVRRSMQLHHLEGVDGVPGMGDENSVLGFNLMLPRNWVCAPHPDGMVQDEAGSHCKYVLGHRQNVDAYLKAPNAHMAGTNVILLHLCKPDPGGPLASLEDFITKWHIPIRCWLYAVNFYRWVQPVPPSVCNRVQGNHRFWAWELRMGYHQAPAGVVLVGDDESVRCSSPSLSEHGSAPPEPDPECRPEHEAHWFADHDGVPHSGVAGGSLVDGLPLLTPATPRSRGQPRSSPGDWGDADTGGQVVEHVWHLGTEGCGLFWYFQVENYTCNAEWFLQMAQQAQSIASTLRMVKSSKHDSLLKGPRRLFRKSDKDLPLKTATEDRNFELVSLPPPGLPPAKSGPLWGSMLVTVRHPKFRSGHLSLRVHPEATVGEVASLAAKELQTTQCSCSDCP